MNTITTFHITDIASTLIKCKLFDNIVDLLLTNTHVNHIGRSVVQIAYRNAKQRPSRGIDKGDCECHCRDGWEWWCKNGRLHRDWDLPARIEKHHPGQSAGWYECDTKYWYQNGKLHRNGDKPAIVSAHGDMEWYQNDHRCRNDDKPSVIHADGTKEWWINTKLHRDGDKPALIMNDGPNFCYKFWYKNGVEYFPHENPPLSVELDRWNGSKNKLS